MVGIADLFLPIAPRRKRVSRRRWKARALLGQRIPWAAIVEHALPGPWNVADYNREGYTSVRRRRKGVEWFQRETFIRYPTSAPDDA